VQWTGTQQWVFVFAGLMHLSSLGFFWLWFRGRFERVNLQESVDMGQAHRGLLSAGGVLAGLGALLAWLIAANWKACLTAASFSGAAQALTAAAGLVVIGLALLHAGRPRAGGGVLQTV
jgi:ACS family hexuronate transporter-like MFS transporter